MDLRTRLSTLIALRLLVSTLLLGSAVLMEVRGGGAYPINPYFALIGITYALSIAYVATLRVVERRPWLLDAQLGADAVLVSAFIGVTGGVTSYFSSLYFLPIIAASRIRFRRGALQLATLTSLLYIGLVSSQYAGTSQAVASAWRWMDAASLPPLGMAAYMIAINVFGFFAVALLSGSLAEGWRTAGAKLERASMAIADLREFNELVINNLLSGLVTAGDDGLVLTFNRAAGAITGIAPDQAIGRHLADLFQLPDGERGELAGLAAMKTLRTDLQYARPDGTAVEVGFTATTLAFPDGRLGYLATFQDVTQVRRLERQARMQQRLAAVGEMAAGIAHEIRNPLASMSGSIQVLRQELSLSDEQAQLMDIVVRESDRLNDTIRSFLTYAKPQRFAVRRLDVGALVRDVGLLLRNGPEVGERHRVDVDVPIEPLWYEADDTQLRQVLWNLASNGLRAMPDGGALRLAVCVEPNGALRLEVADTGRGMTGDELEHMFQPFRSSFQNGTGLGLAIVHRIVQDYGGGIDVSSDVGRGTTFRVRLPKRFAATGPADAVDPAYPMGMAV